MRKVIKTNSLGNTLVKSGMPNTYAIMMGDSPKHIGQWAYIRKIWNARYCHIWSIDEVSGCRMHVYGVVNKKEQV